MRVLLIGSGGREHAIGWKLAQSSRVDELISLPGNPGLAELGPIAEGVSPTEVGAVAALARAQKVDVVVVGPEGPLAAGVVDALSTLGIPTFGPSRAAARLESSKAFAKEVMGRAGVATAESAVFTDPVRAHDHIRHASGPYVVKADGLAAGKGVLVTESRKEAARWIDICFEGRFGSAGTSVLVEQYLEGPEISVFTVCTETGVRPLAPARDYKRLEDGDRGPNTGGMGSYSPVDDLPPDLVARVVDDVVIPVLAEMDQRGSRFRGFLYAGMVLTDDGPKVLEFNVRLGDPETQAVLPRMRSDLVDVLEGADPVWSDEATVNVVLAAKGYPERPVGGDEIRGLGAVPDDVIVFHAGTKREGKRLLVDGGRVLNLVGLGPTVTEARDAAYKAVSAVSWPGMQHRGDIAAQS